MSACPGPVLLDRFVDGTCTHDEDRAVQEHLATCATCKDHVETARSDGALLAQLRDAVDVVAMPRQGLLPAVPGFRIRRLLGAGGMGVVYEAEQLSPRRPVALKVLRSGLPSPSTLRRFELEREVLARLEHPGIARIHAAGTYEVSGETRPFFAMELVQGQRLGEWLQRGGHARPGRLLLFANICDAVEHAHRRGVVHRDLKPGNVLVTVDGEVKVVDFGVARLIDDDGGDVADRTRADQCVGTLPYMSPEQLEGARERIDTRTDVWALGVLLFEMLTARLPHDLAGLARMEAVQRVRETPVRLGQIDRSLRGDLEVIVGKALRVDPDERYASAGALGDDIRRFLGREPIAAHPPSAWYQLRKFASRHRWLVAVAVIALIGFATAFVLVRGERDRAFKAAQRAEAVVDLLKEVLLQADPKMVMGQEPTIRDAVREAEARMKRHVPDDPWVEAVVRHTLAQVQFGLGDYDEAERNFARALEQFRAAHAGVVKIAYVLRGQAELLLHRSNFDDAEAAAREALALGEAGGTDANSVAAMHNLVGLACQQTGRLDEAERCFREALRLWRTTAEGGGAVGGVLANIGTVHESRGDTDAAMAAYEESLATVREFFGEGHPHVGATLDKIGVLQIRTGKLEEAEATLVASIAMGEERLGAEHPGLAVRYVNFGSLRRLQKRHDEAAEAFASAVTAARKKGATHPHLLAALSRQAGSLRDAGRGDEAVAVLRELADRLAEARGADHVSVLVARARLAGAEGGTERDARLDEIERELEERLDAAEGDAKKSLEQALARVRALRVR